jgi:hypothetical protein
MMVLHDAGIDQGGFGAAEGASQQLVVLREAADFGMRILQDAGRDQGGWSVAECRRHQLAVLLRKF